MLNHPSSTNRAMQGWVVVLQNWGCHALGCLLRAGVPAPPDLVQPSPALLASFLPGCVGRGADISAALCQAGSSACTSLWQASACCKLSCVDCGAGGCVPFQGRGASGFVREVNLGGDVKVLG